MTPLTYDLLGGAAQTVHNTAAANAYTTAVPVPGGDRWVLHLNAEATAGDGGDACILCLQTTYDGSVWQDLASVASKAGGTVAAINEFIEALTPKAAARLAASDGALAASTINSTALGFLVRIKGNITDADNDGRWKINTARLLIYP